jgi:peptidoglycan/LPS O-acetylase OafA/YrhL
VASAAKAPAVIRLDHIDAMRPLKQAGVITTHSLQYLVPAANVTAGGVALLTHVTREAFLFISACMATYAYRHLRSGDLGRFYRRRLAAIGLPYLVWTLIYFGYQWRANPQPLGHEWPTLWLYLTSGYYQLYFLVALAQFYLLFPAFLALLRASRRHPWWLLGASMGLQLALTTMTHWDVAGFGWLESYWGMRLVINYQLYLVAGGLTAFNYREVDGWIRTHVAIVVSLLITTAAVAETWYVLASRGIVAPGLAASDDAQPAVIPFFLAAIVAVYLAGVWLSQAKRSSVVRWLTRSSADCSYGIYLSQMLFILTLSELNWSRLASAITWPGMVASAVAITFVGGWLLTGLATRTPLAKAVAGRRRVQRRRPSEGTVAGLGAVA